MIETTLNSPTDPDELKRLSRGISSDMSPTAISERLDIVSGLFDLFQTFQTARFIGRVNRLNEAHPGDIEAQALPELNADDGMLPD